MEHGSTWHMLAKHAQTHTQTPISYAFLKGHASKKTIPQNVLQIKIVGQISFAIWEFVMMLRYVICFAQLAINVTKESAFQQLIVEQIKIAKLGKYAKNIVVWAKTEDKNDYDPNTKLLLIFKILKYRIFNIFLFSIFFLFSVSLSFLITYFSLIINYIALVSYKINIIIFSQVFGREWAYLKRNTIKQQSMMKIIICNLSIFSIIFSNYPQLFIFISFNKSQS